MITREHLNQSAIEEKQALILRAAQLSAFAYSNTGSLGSPFNFIAKNISNGNSQAFIGTDETPNRTWVVFTGSQDRKDWRDDLKYSFVAFNGGTRGNIHSGFLRHYERIADQITAGISDAARSGHEIIFAGHSLGGAVAQLAAAIHQDRGYNASAIAIGAPRIFCPRASFYLDHVANLPITRVESLTDWIADLPPRVGRFPYSHAGHCLFIDSRGRVTTEDRPLFVKAAFVMKRITLGIAAWRVHSANEYVSRIQRWINRNPK